MSHYPTTAELAAFRRMPPDRMTYPATRWERVYGTVREAGQRDHDADPARHTLARREASALRSRAFARMARPAHPDVPMTPAEYDALRDAVRAFAPTW